GSRARRATRARGVRHRPPDARARVDLRGADRRSRADPALHGHPVRRAGRPVDAACHDQSSPPRCDLLDVLDRSHADPVRRDGRTRRRQRSRRPRGQSLPLARQVGIERRARRARRAHPRRNERSRPRPGRGAREAAAEGARVTRRVGLLGGGVIGGGWAARFLLNGLDVVLYDPDPEAPRKLDEVLDNARRAYGRLTYAPLPPEGTLTFAATPEEAAHGVDFVQESAPERVDLKRALLGAASRVAPADVVIASSTSGFLPSALQGGMEHPERLTVGHPFNPVYLLPLVEVCSPSSETVERASDFYRSIGMHPLVVRQEIDGFIADRLLEALWREALGLVNDGVATVEEIDDAIRYGPGLRWSSMGTFLLYRIAGGESGMRHFMEQFGPALQWPWSKLTDVPDLTPELLDRLEQQSDAQAAGRTVRDLERCR